MFDGIRNFFKEVKDNVKRSNYNSLPIYNLDDLITLVDNQSSYPYNMRVKSLLDLKMDMLVFVCDKTLYEFVSKKLLNFQTNSSSILDIRNNFIYLKKTYYYSSPEVCSSKRYVFIRTEDTYNLPNILEVIIRDYDLYRRAVEVSDTFMTDLINYMSIDFKTNENINNFINTIKSMFNVYDVNENSIKITLNIVPDKYISGTERAPIINNMYRGDLIQNIKITFNPDLYVTSVQLMDGKHPNADKDGFYCLGELKFKKLDDCFIFKLIENMKIYNLIDCYYVPNWFKL